MNELPVGFITLGVLISTWICYAVGTAWRDTMVLNSSLNKLLLWSAVTHSCISFTMPFVIGLVWVLTMGEEPAMTPVKARQLMGWIYNPYMTVSFLVVGSSLAIWAHLLRVAYRRRDFTRIVTPTWDGLTKIGSMTSAANSITFALNSVGNLFSGKIGASPIKVTGALTILAAMVLLPGVLIALVLVRHFAHTSESRIEAYAQNGFVHT